jgi:hypothetical protein
MWSLMQVGEIKRKPLIVVGRVWGETVSTFLREAGDFIRPEDAAIIRVAARVDDVAPIIREA